MKRALETLKLATEHLKKCEVARPRRVAEELLAAVLGCPRIGLYMQFDQPLLETELAQYCEYVARAARHEPYEYIVGTVEFYKCSLQVNSHVLIPRQETEIMLDALCQRLPEQALEVWDLCTGSGCLGIGLKKALPQHQVTLSDISKEALVVARGNAERNEVEVMCAEGDLLTPFEGKKADVVLCNPPYVTEGEWEGLDRSVRDYEPKMALVGGERGLDFYAELASLLPKYLNRRGKVFLEMGWQQARAVSQLFDDAFWSRKEVIEDWAGNDRFFFLEAH